MRLDRAGFTLGAIVASAVMIAAQQPQQVGTPGVQAGRDPNRAAFVAANCKAQPAAAAPAAGGNAPGGNAARAGGAAAPGAANAAAGRGANANAAPPVLLPPDPAPAIPGVLAAGQRWRKV